MNVVEAMPELFGAAFRDVDSWRAWQTVLRAIFALPMSEADVALYQACTGRQTPPTTPAREAFLIIGRRGGKSFITAYIAVWLATKSYEACLAPGEKATVALIAADRQQARVLFRYVVGLFEAVPMLRGLVERQTASAIELSNRVVLEVHICSYRSVRGYAFAVVIADEAAFWRDEASATPDVEVLNAVRPGLATIPGSLLLVISSPYARRGVLWNAYKEHFGKDGDPVLVWRAPSRVMNPTVPEHVIETALAADEPAARAEYFAEFRRDLEAFVAREIVDACTVPGRHELPPMADTSYVGFVDPSGGSADAFTLAIAHREGDRVVLDVLRERKPPFSPSAVVREFAALLKAYRLASVSGDRYAGEWPREQFRAHGVEYVPATSTKSDLYVALLPALNSHRVELLNLPRLHSQLCGLERRTARGGKDSIDHGPGGHDDVANAVAGVVTLALGDVEDGLFTYYRQGAEEYARRQRGEVPVDTGPAGRALVPENLSAGEALARRRDGVARLEAAARRGGLRIGY
jgi:hypothetical protein